jgi:hypothetical protein
VAVPRAEVLGGEVVVAGQAGEHLVLPLLVAAQVVQDPVPLGRHVVQDMLRRRGEHVDIHRVHLVDVVAPRREVDGGVGLQHHADTPVGIGAAVTQTVLHGLHRVADGMAVDEVHED